MVLGELSDQDVFRSHSEGIVLEVLRGVEEFPERGFLFVSLHKCQGLAVLLLGVRAGLLSRACSAVLAKGAC